MYLTTSTYEYCISLDKDINLTTCTYCNFVWWYISEDIIPFSGPNHEVWYLGFMIEENWFRILRNAPGRGILAWIEVSSPYVHERNNPRNCMFELVSLVTVSMPLLTQQVSIFTKHFFFFSIPFRFNCFCTFYLSMCFYDPLKTCTRQRIQMGIFIQNTREREMGISLVKIATYKCDPVFERVQTAEYIKVPYKRDYKSNEQHK